MFIRVGAQWFEISALDEARVDRLDPEFVKKALDNPKRFKPRDSVSPKGVGSRRVVSKEKQIVAAYLQAMKPGADKLAYSRAKMAWTRYKVELKNQFYQHVTDLMTGKTTKTQFLHRSRILFKTGYEKAYRLGTDAAGLDFVKLPKEDLLWLSRGRSYEYKFLDKFADDIKAKRGVMSYKDRSEMYVDNMDGIFDAGRVDGYPVEGTKIYWELGSSQQPCGDCIDLAMGSPYRPDTLPTTPRAGNTMCLSNCRCSLRIRYEKPEKIRIDVKPVSRTMAKAVGLAVLGVTAATLWKMWRSGEASTPVLDWNTVDDAVTALAELRTADSVKNPEVKHILRVEALKRFEQTGRDLPPWLDPFSRDLYVWHAVGAYVLECAIDLRREGRL